MGVDLEYLGFGDEAFDCKNIGIMNEETGASKNQHHFRSETIADL